MAPEHVSTLLLSDGSYTIIHVGCPTVMIIFLRGHHNQH